MEWIRIGTHKLKIMLSAEDARRYALDCERADYTDLVTKDAFREILTDVRAASGFEAGDDKIYIQMYPSKTGGCELFVTRMGLAFEDSEAVKIAPVAQVQKPKSPETVRKKGTALRFSTLEELLHLCRRLPAFEGKSSAWRDEHGSWWLLLCAEGTPEALQRCFRLLREYGKLHDLKRTELLLCEHGRPVCTADAVRILGAL